MSERPGRSKKTVAPDAAESDVGPFADDAGAEAGEPAEAPKLSRPLAEAGERAAAKLAAEKAAKAAEVAGVAVPVVVVTDPDPYVENRARLDNYAKEQMAKVKIESDEPLDGHFRDHSQNLILAIMKAAKAADKVRRTKDQLDRLSADVDYEFRQRTEKTTEELVKKAVLRDPRIIEVKAALAFSEYQMSVYQGVVRGWDHKRDMMIQLGSNYRAELSHDPSLRGDNRPPAARQAAPAPVPAPRRREEEDEDYPPPRAARPEPRRAEPPRPAAARRDALDEDADWPGNDEAPPARAARPAPAQAPRVRDDRDADDFDDRQPPARRSTTSGRFDEL